MTRINGSNPKYDRAYVKRTDAGDLAIGLAGYDPRGKRPGYVTAFFTHAAARRVAEAILTEVDA